jgi:hypothetical protein
MNQGVRVGDLYRHATGNGQRRIQAHSTAGDIQNLHLDSRPLTWSRHHRQDFQSRGTIEFDTGLSPTVVHVLIYRQAAGKD